LKRGLSVKRGLFLLPGPENPLQVSGYRFQGKTIQIEKRSLCKGGLFLLPGPENPLQVSGYRFQGKTIQFEKRSLCKEAFFVAGCQLPVTSRRLPGPYISSFPPIVRQFLFSSPETGNR
jgi:hypothetical protein